MKPAYVLLLCLLLAIGAGCIHLGPTPAVQNQTNRSALNQTNRSGGNATGACAGTACFVSAANECRNLSMTITEEAGVFAYSTSSGCVFTKTLVSLGKNETQEMKALLQGKSMTCSYGKGKFDQRLVTTLVFGAENCTGGLKDALGRLAVFSG